MRCALRSLLVPVLCLTAMLPRPSAAELPAPAAPASLCSAAKSGDLQALKACIAQGQDANARGSDGLSPLDLAALRGDAEACRLLLAAGADPKAVDALGMTALHEAAFSGKGEVVQLLVSKGAAVGLPDRAGLTPLHYAAAGGNLQVMTLLLTSGADLHAKTQEGLTPGALAAKSHQQAAADFLKARETVVSSPVQASNDKQGALTPAAPRVYTNEDLAGLRETSRLANEDQLAQGSPGTAGHRAGSGSTPTAKQDDRLNALQDERDRLVREKRDEEDKLPQLEKQCQEASKAGQGANSNIQAGPGFVTTSTGYETTRGAMRDQAWTCQPLRQAQNRIQELERRIAQIDRQLNGGQMSGGQGQQQPAQGGGANRKKNRGGGPPQGQQPPG